MSENAKELKERLMMKERRGAASFTAEELKEANAYCEGYKTFLDNARTEREAVCYIEKLAMDSGITKKQASQIIIDRY